MRGKAVNTNSNLMIFYNNEGCTSQYFLPYLVNLFHFLPTPLLYTQYAFDELYDLLHRRQNFKMALCQDESKFGHCSERLDIELEGVTDEP